MPPLKEVRNRIKSVKNISQITRALEAVSASRVRKAQARVMASRAFAEKAWEILVNLQNSTGVSHPLLTPREDLKKVMVILITSDRGLAGSYNTNVMRVAERFEERVGVPVEYVTVGRKGRDSFIRARKNVVAEFADLTSDVTVADLAPIARLAMDSFLSGSVDEVVIAYTDFVTMLSQQPVVRVWMPLSTNSNASRVASDLVKAGPTVSTSGLSYDYEPNAAAVLDEIVPRFTELQLYQALLEAQASEHAARMAAMRNATDNASQLVADLTLDYNKARQAAITNEILDIVGGANALQQSLDKLAKEIEKQLVAIDTPVVKATKTTSTKSNADDLTKIEGIGPKMSKALIEAGITTFEKLAKAGESELRSAIEKAGMKLAPSLASWAEQAELAAKGSWDALKKLQDQLGRKA